MTELDQATIDRILRRGVAEIIVQEEFVARLRKGKPLRLKMGFDPSRPDIHLGHVVGLRKLKQLQELGHQVILIVGDWTAQIGDPSGMSATRTMLSAEEVRQNAESYLRQFFKVVDPEKTQAVWQSEWFGGFTLADVIELTARFTVAQFLARDDFASRYRANRPIAITELLYPLLQAYDSVAIRADVEFGGTDQKFNLLVGRDLQQMRGQRQQQCFLMPMLPGTDGVQKMSKSLGNYIGITEPPHEMYGKVMSLPDHLTLTYFELLTDVSDSELEEMRQTLESRAVNPMELKKRLGEELVAQFHSRAAAAEARTYFERVVQRGETPEEGVKEYRLPPSASVGEPGGYVAVDLTSMLVETGTAQSRSEARRLIAQGAVEVDGQPVMKEEASVKSGTIIRVGKRRFVRIVDAQDTSN